MVSAPECRLHKAVKSSIVVVPRAANVSFLQSQPNTRIVSVMEITPCRQYGWGKAVRLRKHAQYCRVQSKGRRLGGKFLFAIFAPSSILNARFGLTVSKRVGNAVIRNRVKRRLRDILRHHKTVLGGLDVVWIAKAEAASASYHQLQHDVSELMERILKSNHHVGPR